MLFNAHLLTIATDENRRHAVELNCSTIASSSSGSSAGKPFKVRAQNYALACGGIENVRLLQLSASWAITSAINSGVASCCIRC